MIDPSRLQTILAALEQSKTQGVNNRGAGPTPTTLDPKGIRTAEPARPSPFVSGGGQSEVRPLLQSYSLPVRSPFLGPAPPTEMPQDTHEAWIERMRRILGY